MDCCQQPGEAKQWPPEPCCMHALSSESDSFYRLPVNPWDLSRCHRSHIHTQDKSYNMREREREKRRNKSHENDKKRKEALYSTVT